MIHSRTLCLPLAVAASAWSFTDSLGSWETRADLQLNLGCVRSRPYLKELRRADRFGGNWGAESVPAEMAWAWDTLPAFAELSLGARRQDVELLLRLPLRRDLESWRGDPVGFLPVPSPSQLDINVPREAWMRLDTRVGEVRLGRFAPEVSPSHGVILSGTPWIDGLTWKLSMGHVRYRFLAASLNPWLNGTPTDSSGRIPSENAVGSLSAPLGSENWRQSHLALGDQHGRIYDDPYKSLFLHSLGYVAGAWEFTVIEQTLVGGKAPQFRDANPFMVWHDNFGDGYSRSFFSFEVRRESPELGLFWSQLSTQLLKSPVGEDIGYDPPLQAAAALGWKRDWSGSSGRWAVASSVAATTPTFDNHLLPLLKMTSRQLYRSNARDQSDPDYADVFEVDDPLGYVRGPDAVDVWNRLGWQEPSDAWGLWGELDLLQQGEATLETDIKTLMGKNLPLSGVVERELRAVAGAQARLTAHWRWHGSLGLSVFQNRDHRNGEDGEASPLWSCYLSGSY